MTSKNYVIKYLLTMTIEKVFDTLLIQEILQKTFIFVYLYT